MQILNIWNRFQQSQFMQPLNIKRLPALLLGLGVSTALIPSHAFAAERVLMRHGTYQDEIPVAELRQFAQNGRISPKVQAYIDASWKDAATARKGLNAKIEATPASLNQLLNSWAGPILLNQIGQVVREPSGQADYKALQTALSTSIQQDGKITFLNAIQNYPNPVVEIQSDRIATVYQRLSILAGRGF